MKTVNVRFMKTSAARGKEEYLFSVLPEDRVEKARKYVRENDRLLSLCAGYLVYRFVGEYAVDAYGKPRSDRLFFSLSHSGDLVGLAVCEDREVGLDIEKRDGERDEDALAAYCFSDEELEEYRRDGDFLSLFTSKESLSKAEGRGLGDVKNIPALPLDGAVGYCGKTYHRHSLGVSGFSVSVALEGDDFAIETNEIEVI